MPILRIRRGGALQAIASFFFKLLMVLSVAIVFCIARTFNIQHMSSLAIDGLTQWIYLPSGIRLVAVVIFGWLGAAGIFFGWIFCHVFNNEKTLYECMFIGVISGLTALISLRIWRLAFGVNEVLVQLNLRLLVSLVIVSAFISALVRFAYIFSVDSKASLLEIFTVGFIGDILGSFIVLYLIKLIFFIKKQL
jgi:hypothetical protein